LQSPTAISDIGIKHSFCLFIYLFIYLFIFALLGLEFRALPLEPATEHSFMMDFLTLSQKLRFWNHSTFHVFQS
jgi:hypothetical protein